MNPNDINDFKKAMETITSAIDSSEKFLVGKLAVRLNKAAEENPGDQTIYSLSAFLRSKAEKDMFISKAELKSVYNKFYTNGTFCADYLESELGKKAEFEGNKMVRDQNEGQFDYFKSADPVLVNALESAFDPKVALKQFSNEIAKLAENTCGKELCNFPVQPVKIEAIDGNEDVILCKASYETPKGKSHVLIPVEVNGNKTLFPTVFVSNAGFETLNRDNLGKHLVATAGKSFKANVGAILNVIKTAKHGATEESLNDVEKIVLKASLNKKANVSENAMFFELNDKNDGNVELNANSEDVESFAQKLSSNKGLAEITFGKAVVDAGRNMIRQAMESFGHKVQIVVSDVNKTQVIYSASNGITGIKVPVKFANNKPIPPSIALAGGTVESFDQEGINKLFNENDFAQASLASEYYGSKPNELIETIKVSMSEQNYEKAEEALNVLANSGDKKAYQYGMGIYLNEIGSKPVEKTASSITKCAMQVKSPNSIHIMCGHTNLPLNKVYQDSQGNCLPLYHKNVEHTNESGSFLDSKLYIG
jgi:hypothetical protein